MNDHDANLFWTLLGALASLALVAAMLREGYQNRRSDIAARRTLQHTITKSATVTGQHGRPNESTPRIGCAFVTDAAWLGAVTVAQNGSAYREAERVAPASSKL